MYFVETDIEFCKYENRSIHDINKIEIYISEGEFLPQASITNSDSPNRTRTMHTGIKTIMLINKTNLHFN
jgi:hypothetical protein